VAKSSEIQYGPNVKPKAGSQGTLFRGVKPTDVHRYQRGFTPARKQEVENNVRFVGPQQLNSQAADVIARSTVPLNNLRRLTVQPAGLPGILAQRQQVNRKQREDVRYGENRRGRNTVALATPTQQGIDSPRSQDVRGQILVHEIGHHVGESTRPTPRNDRMRGAEEAHADNFLAAHYRPDPRSVRRGNTAGDYSYRGQSNVAGRPSQFAGAYNATRRESGGRSNSVPQRTQWSQGSFF
jgi:hypothetical protein